MSLLKTILILLMVYFGLKFLFRLLTPYFLRYLSKKASQRFGSFFDEFSQQAQEPKEEGKISIDHMPKRRRQSNNSVGEYVEFEELD